ncbi:SRPBCC family protein [Streptomyces sp. NPDC050560]|uniref:SRPBCC family protein n=1 Tax=Streptomyces sp. NPDC050560 TaxID=3365630 RepID=UPI003795B10A
MTTIDPGTFVTHQGRDAVRFERIYDHPVERVWSAVTEPAELAHWFPQPEITVELAVNGVITLAGDPNMPDDSLTGRVVTLDPPRAFAFTWGPDELRFDLEPLDGGRTRLTLTDVLAERNSAAMKAAGWDVCLASLDARLEKRPVAPTDWEDRYAVYTAEGFPTGARVPGRD